MVICVYFSAPSQGTPDHSIRKETTLSLIQQGCGSGVQNDFGREK
jgi:hypothetical protein